MGLHKRSVSDGNVILGELWSFKEMGMPSRVDMQSVYTFVLVFPSFFITSSRLSN